MLYITLRQYEYVVAVAAAQSLTAAAARLHVSQPSLSVAISRVEEKLGQRIFARRKGASIVVTPYGHQFIKKAQTLLEMATDIERKPKTSPPFVVGCFEDIAPWYLASILEGLQSHFPGVAFEGREGRFSSLASDLAEGRADIVISYDIGFDGNFGRRKLREIAPVAFLSHDHPLAERSSVGLEQLADHPLILSSEDLSEGYMRTLFDTLQLLPNVVRRTSSLEMMRSLAAQGIGIGISYSHPPCNVSYDGKPLVTVPISTPLATAEITLLWSGLRKSDPEFTDIQRTIAELI